MRAAKHSSPGAKSSQRVEPQPQANGLHSAEAEPDDALPSAPPSAFAAEEVQKPAAVEAAAELDPAVAAAVVFSKAESAHVTASSEPLTGGSAIAVAAAPSLATRLQAGTGVLASAQVPQQRILPQPCILTCWCRQRFA